MLEKCKYKIEDNTSAPKNYFEVIMMCEQALKNSLEHSETLEILVFVYMRLRQFKKAAFYSRLAFESRPNAVNKFFYAAYVEYTPEWEKAIPLYQELIKTSALAFSNDWEFVTPESMRRYSENDLSDLARFNLARLLKGKGHLKLAYELYDKIADPDYIKSAKEIMSQLEVELPNLAKKKSYRAGEKIISLDEQYVYLPIEQMPLPRVQKLNNKGYFLDPIRRKPVKKTPEEVIRQKTIRYLIDEIKIPENLILVEESLNHKDKSLKDRVDILVKYFTNGNINDLLIVECKEPGILLSGDAIEQILRYNQYCEAKYLLLTNGVYSLIYHNAGDDKYLPCEELPDYKTMVGADFKPAKNTIHKEWHKPSRKKLDLQEYRDNGEYWGIVGVDSSKDIVVFALNMHYCLVDASKKMVYDKKGFYFKEIRDLGLTNRKTGDPSGSKFYLDCRWFEIQSNQNQTLNVYIAMAGFAKSKNDPIYGTRKGSSNIIVSLEHKGNAVPILELCLDR